MELLVLKIIYMKNTSRVIRVNLWREARRIIIGLARDDGILDRRCRKYKRLTDSIKFELVLAYLGLEVRKTYS